MSNINSIRIGIILVVVFIIIVRMVNPIGEITARGQTYTIDPFFADEPMRDLYDMFKNDPYGNWNLSPDNLIHILVITIIGGGALLILNFSAKEKELTKQPEDIDKKEQS